jgi:hypothetical protein
VPSVCKNNRPHMMNSFEVLYSSLWVRDPGGRLRGTYQSDISLYQVTPVRAARLLPEVSRVGGRHTRQAAGDTLFDPVPGCGGGVV